MAAVTASENGCWFCNLDSRAAGTTMTMGAVDSNSGDVLGIACLFRLALVGHLGLAPFHRRRGISYPER